MASVLSPNIVYRSSFSKPGALLSRNNTLVPTIRVVGGTINFHADVTGLQPVSVAAMTLLPDDAGIEGDYPIATPIKWFGYTVASGTPVVTEVNVITEGEN